VGVGHRANKFSLSKYNVLQNVTHGLELEPEQILEITYATENGYEIWNMECLESV
jgi:hypothetical protein